MADRRRGEKYGRSSSTELPECHSRLVGEALAEARSCEKCAECRSAESVNDRRSLLWSVPVDLLPADAVAAYPCRASGGNCKSRSSGDRLRGCVSSLPNESFFFLFCCVPPLALLLRGEDRAADADAALLFVALRGVLTVSGAVRSLALVGEAPRFVAEGGLSVEVEEELAVVVEVEVDLRARLLL